MSCRKLIAHMNMSVRFDVVSPSIFHPGDIVEAQVSLVIFPAKEGRSVMRLMLWSLAPLDGQFAQVCSTTFVNICSLFSYFW